MYLKYYSFLLLLCIKHFVNGYSFLDMTSTFKHLSDQLRPVEAYRAEDIKTRWIEQALDNFDPEEERTWNMRYFERLNFWKENGPIYLLLGGEGTATSTWTRTGIMYELAQETNGAMFVSEHRFYGESKPLSTSDVKNYKYLSSRQALADNAKLLKYIKSQTMFENSKVVVIGGSYAGNLAAWMKLLYPELVDAALASSPPVLAKKNFYEYLEKVNENYKRYGTPDCLNRTRNIFQRYDRLLQTPEGINQLKKEERICEDCDLTVKENQNLFFISKLTDFTYNSQYGTPAAIQRHCTYLERSLKPKWQQCRCFNFNKTIEAYKAQVNDYILQWTYQTCTEFGYFVTTSSDAQPFTDNVDLDYHIKVCTALFGEEFNETRVDVGIDNTNNFYGGLTPNVTKVVFSNGNMDPWSRLSILQNLSDEAPAVVIPRATHCKDLLSDARGDVDELKAARRRIKRLIKNWIQ